MKTALVLIAVLAVAVSSWKKPDQSEIDDSANATKMALFDFRLPNVDVLIDSNNKDFVQMDPFVRDKGNKMADHLASGSRKYNH